MAVSPGTAKTRPPKMNSAPNKAVQDSNSAAATSMLRQQHASQRSSGRSGTLSAPRYFDKG
jgi:hypothetical protein